MNTVKFFHLRDVNRVPFATVAKNIDGIYGFAVCSPNDHFDKAMGRQIALGRLMFNPFRIPNPNRLVNFHGRVMTVKECVESFVKYRESSSVSV